MSANEPNQMLDVLAHDGVLRVERGAAKSGRALVNVTYNAVSQPALPDTQR
ncbi:MAG: hypothetical protein P8O03_01990 [Ilumatobacter sp.]|nr:hypothetical protein [Ilumatobacter sp.]MDG2039972.1 hypothetical protein [Ilumatobacter sp.]